MKADRGGGGGGKDQRRGQTPGIQWKPTTIWKGSKARGTEETPDARRNAVCGSGAQREEQESRVQCSRRAKARSPRKNRPGATSDLPFTKPTVEVLGVERRQKVQAWALHWFQRAKPLGPGSKWLSIFCACNWHFRSTYCISQIFHC